MTSEVKGFPKVEAAQSAAKVLRAVADLADAGEVVGVVIVEHLKNGNYRISHGRTLNRLELLGALFEAAYELQRQ